MAARARGGPDRGQDSGQPVSYAVYRPVVAGRPSQREAVSPPRALAGSEAALQDSTTRLMATEAALQDAISGAVGAESTYLMARDIYTSSSLSPPHISRADAERRLSSVCTQNDNLEECLERMEVIASQKQRAPDSDGL